MPRKRLPPAARPAQAGLFGAGRTGGEPLAARMRPRDLEDFVGQERVVGEGRPLRRMVERDEVPSMILWGPPGSGKTTLASIVAQRTKRSFVQLSAVSSGVADLRAAIAEAQAAREREGIATILFVDEIHRFNKAQQDALLPYVERGTVVLLGATTENPSFEVIPALRSRCRIFTLQPLDDAALGAILERALLDRERGLGERGLALAADARE